ncbi:hypothetical protein [Gracilibacillus phocaeensis]|uniref:hypothetical protein n=1 Tax=Gracilibacillus phocaeensis TaxID=2042304 RepID=UPI000AA441C5|nr:hypothetical protein [Gracilibacillus phocaeensis]
MERMQKHFTYTQTMPNKVDKKTATFPAKVLYSLQKMWIKLDIFVDNGDNSLNNCYANS